jgi:hypothetical protein
MSPFVCHIRAALTTRMSHEGRPDDTYVTYERSLVVRRSRQHVDVDSVTQRLR